MKKNENLEESELLLDLKFISRKLSTKQKEIIKLLQNKEVLITNEKGIIITCGNETKKVTLHAFYNLVNKGLIFHQTKWPFNYILSRTGETIKI